MSNDKNMTLVDKDGNDPKALQKKVAKKKKESRKRNLNFVPHPNMIFASVIDKQETESGIILPEQSEDKTPIGELVAVGDNITGYEKGQVVYLVPEYMRFCEIDGIELVVTYEDGIFGHIPKEE